MSLKCVKKILVVLGVVYMCHFLLKVSSVNPKISPCGILRTACEILTLHPEPSTRISRDPKTSQLSIGNVIKDPESTTPISRNPKTSQSKIKSVQKCTDAKKIVSVDPKILPVSAYHVDIKNHVKIENLLLQEVKYEKSGRKFKAFRVMNSFNTSTSRSIRCFHHFKCLICQIEIYGSEALIYHAKSKSHVEMSKHYIRTDTEKLSFMSKTLDKLHETEKKLKEKDEYLLKLTAKLASKRSRLES